MRELLHHFGFIDNRVQVGLSEIRFSKHSHGVVLCKKNRVYRYFVVDQPNKLASPSIGMVADMVTQLSKLGVEADVIELNAQNTTFTYQVTPDNTVERLSTTAKHW